MNAAQIFSDVKELFRIEKTDVMSNVSDFMANYFLKAYISFKDI